MGSGPPALLLDRLDVDIRSALKDADRNGTLGVIATETGIAGGVEELRRIMNSTGDLAILDRGMLAIHLDLVGVEFTGIRQTG